MAVTNVQIDDTINKAQQRIGDLALQAARKEMDGENADKDHAIMRGLRIAIIALQDDNGNYTSDNKDDIVSWMNCIGDIQALSTVTFDFQSCDIVILNQQGTFVGLTDTDNTYLGHDCKIAVVDEALQQFLFQTLGLGSNVLIVSANGDNTKAKRGHLTCHWQTIIAAQSAAVSGDTIVVMPGSYSIQDGELLGKDGVTYYFIRGAIVTLTNSTTGSAMWEVSGSATYTISGDGRFVNTIASKSLILCAASNSIRAKGTFVNNIAFDGMVKSGGTLVLEDCIIVLSDTARFPVAASSAQSVEVFEAASNASGQDTDITYNINNILLDAVVV